MNISFENPDKVNGLMTITVEEADFKDNVEKTLKDYRKKANYPGFRPGMVPMGLIKKQFGTQVKMDAVNKFVGEQIYKYVKDNDIAMLGEPLPSEKQVPVDIEKDAPYTFVFDIAVAPEFDAKLNGHNKLTQYVITITDEMVDKQVNSYAERFGEYVDVEAVQDGDMLKGLLTEQKEGGIVKEGAVLMPAYMKDDAQKALFQGAKKGDVVTFNPTAAYGSEVEVSSLAGISKEEAKDLTSDFTFEIQTITRHQPAAIDGELFAKVYGENNVKDEADFRARVKAEIEANMAEDTKYKFGLDAKAAVMKKMEGLQFPEAFLKRWVLATNEKMTQEELDKDFPKMLEELKWHLAKDQLMKAFEVKVEKEDVEAYAREVARMQFMQYGLMHVEDAYLDNFAQEMLKKEDQLRGIVERVAENKIYEALRGVAKVEEKAISHEDFGKLFA